MKLVRSMPLSLDGPTSPQTPEDRHQRWSTVSYFEDKDISKQEHEIRDTVGFEWDSTHHPYLPDRFNRPLAVTAVRDQYDMAEAIIISLVGTPSRGSVILTGFGNSGFILSTHEMLDDDELAMMVDFVETLFGTRIDQIPVGTTWVSHDKLGKVNPFPSGNTWADVRMPW